MSVWTRENNVREDKESQKKKRGREKNEKKRVERKSVREKKWLWNYLEGIEPVTPRREHDGVSPLHQSANCWMTIRLAYKY